MRWLVTAVQKAVDARYCIDSPNPKAIEAALKGTRQPYHQSLDTRMLANQIIADTLAGRDEFCTNVLQAYREKKFETGDIYNRKGASNGSQ